LIIRHNRRGWIIGTTTLRRKWEQIVGRLVTRNEMLAIHIDHKSRMLRGIVKVGALLETEVRQRNQASSKVRAIKTATHTRREPSQITHMSKSDLSATNTMDSYDMIQGLGRGQMLQCVCTVHGSTTVNMISTTVSRGIISQQSRINSLSWK
jgi:hypothetical protein